MSYSDPGARVNTCPECGHYAWAHGKHGCVVIINKGGTCMSMEPEQCCPCLRTRESFIEKAFDACYRI